MPFFAGNEEHGNYILTAFLGGAIPTGSYTNGAQEPAINPTLAGGKGVWRFDVQSTLGATLPLARGTQSAAPSNGIPHSNTRPAAAPSPARVPIHLPGVEFNSTFFKGGSNDGKTQNFATPGLIARFPIHHRLGLVFGFGDQIATSRFHSYNHGLLFTASMPF